MRMAGVGMGVLCLAMALLPLSGCATFLNPLTGKQQWVVFDTDFETSFGRQLARSIEAEHELVSDPEAQARVDRVCRQIAAKSDRLDVRYACRIVKRDDWNAFVLPGGFIYIHAGLLAAADDAELAAVIAHEIGHVVLRHGIKRLQAQLGAEVLMRVVFGEDMTKQRQAAGVALTVLMLGYSRQDELDADALAVRYAHSAGFDPRGLVTFFEKLRQRYGDTSSFEAWSREHPPLSVRIARAEQQIAAFAP